MVVEHYPGSAGVLDFADTFKHRGVPMSGILADVSLQTKFALDRGEREGVTRETVGKRAGFFKQESPEQSMPPEALDKHRARVTVKYLIHSLKRVTGLKTIGSMERIIDPRIDDPSSPF